MKIKKSTLWWFLAIIILAWFFWPSDYNEEDYDWNYSIKEIVEVDSFQNITFMHWDHMPLTYRFENECVQRQIDLVKLAFEKIEEETGNLVQFENLSLDPDISIYCKPANYSGQGGDTIADALITELDSSRNLIKKGELSFYGQGSICLTGYPALEVHEILHLFKIPHNPLTGSIMSPYSAETSLRCKITEIDEEYVSCLKYIYSNGEIGFPCNFPNFIHENEQEDESSCEDGLYLSQDETGCCPEPNMYVDDEGYCV